MGKKKHHQDKKERIEGTTEAEEPKEEVDEASEKQQPALQAKKVPYCPVCTLPFELCRYSKDSLECASWLFKKAPAKVNKYHPDFKPEMLEGRQSAGEKPKGEKGKEEGKSKSVRDKYVAIDVKNRGKKHYITTVEGLNNFNIEAKEVSKKCAKKFAVSCSVVATGTIQMQGDNFEAMRDFLLGEYKQLKKKYIIDKEELNAKMAEERSKKKEERKREKDVIKEEEGEGGEGEGEGEKKKEEEPNKNELRFQMMAKMEQGSDSDQ